MEERGILPGAFSSSLSRVSASWKRVASSTEVRALALGSVGLRSNPAINFR